MISAYNCPSSTDPNNVFGRLDANFVDNELWCFYRGASLGGPYNQ